MATTERKPRAAAMTDAEVKALALRIYRREVFASFQVPERDIALLSQIFMPLALLDDKSRLELSKKKLGMIYGDMATRLPHSINGYPILSNFTTVNQPDTKRVLAKLREIRETMEKL